MNVINLLLVGLHVSTTLMAVLREVLYKGSIITKTSKTKAQILIKY
jgi:hypothetical protein